MLKGPKGPFWARKLPVQGLGFHCLGLPRTRSTSFYYESQRMLLMPELLSALGLLMEAGRQCWLVRNQNTTQSQGQAFSKICNDSFNHYFAFYFLYLAIHIRLSVIFILWWYCFSLILITRCVRSAHIEITFTLLLCQMCQCNKVIYTVEFSTFSVMWLFMGWTLGEASSAVVHLQTQKFTL